MDKSNKSELFISVINSNKGVIYKIANSYCKDSEDRNDLIQEVILRLWQSFDSYNDEYKHSTWIYRIALNAAISNYRKEKVREKHFIPISEHFFAFDDTINANETEHNFNLLQQFISELKELDKALMLLYLEEKTHFEIAEILGISVSNVGTRIGRIKVILKEKFLQIKNS